ncbi:MAG: hypothetical protein LWW86_04355 [Micrococcales bacterium]|nr:hypothetical protein [Micrococcales bacterium]
MSRSTALRRLTAAGTLALIAATGAALPANAALDAGASTARAMQARTIAPTEVPDVAPGTIAGQPLQWDGGQYTNTPTVAGMQTCDPADEGAQMPTAGRQWMYYDGTNGLTNKYANLTVTGWSDSRSAFRDILRDTGLCTLDAGVHRVRWAGTSPATHLLLTDGSNYAAVIRDGSYVVAVYVYAGDPADPAGARAAAITAANKVAASL